MATPLQDSRRNATREQVILGLALAAITLLAIVMTLKDPGITWDEPLYIKASRGYMGWFGLLKQSLLHGDLRQVLSDEAIVSGWMPHPTLELHPPLGKILSGISWATLRGFLGELAAHRFSNALLFSLLVAMIFWMISSAYDMASGLFAALALVLMPRMFMHAHLANIDTTVAITWFLAIYLFWKYESKPGWLPVVVIGVAFGLALGTKMNAAVMPLVWGVWILLFRRNWRSFLRLAAMGAIGVATFIAMWPWLWHDTANRLAYYVMMASRFKDRPQFYLGQTLPHVPWHYPFVITLAVVPAAITVMSILGIYRMASQGSPLASLRRRLRAASLFTSKSQAPAPPLMPRPSDAQRSGAVPGLVDETRWMGYNEPCGPGAAADETGWLVLLNALTPLMFAATGLQAAYSGERHFIPAYPYLACLAGMGFGAALNTLCTTWQSWHEGARSSRVRPIVAAVLGLLLLAPLLSIVQIHPYELSYYSELVGGMPGAARLGLETTFWCETYKDALPYLNRNASTGSTVWAENPFVLRLYQRYGTLRDDLQVTGGDIISPYVADYALVQMRQTGFQYTPEVVDIMRRQSPDLTLFEQGIALLHVYRLKPEK